MPGHTHLYRRGAVYYFRCAVPNEIKNAYGKREELRSLRTRDHKEAVRKLAVVTLEVTEAFEAHRRRLHQLAEPPLSDLSHEQLATIRAAYLSFRLEEDEEVREEGFEEFEDTPQGRVLLSPVQEAPRPTFEEAEELVEDMDEVGRFNLARRKMDPFFAEEAKEVLSWDGIGLRLAPGSPSWPKVVRALQEASVEAAKLIRQRNRGDVVPTPVSPLDPAAQAAKAPLLSQALREWSEEKGRTSWSTKARVDHAAWTGMFLDIVGDRPLNDYRKADARAFKEVLLKLPANWQKKRETRGLPVQKAAEKAAQAGLEPMSLSNLNKGIRRVSAFWNWAEAHFDNAPKGLFKGLTVKTDVAPRDQRDPFTPEQLETLFASPVFNGCKSASRCAVPGTFNMDRTARYWLPILGVFTGARLNELCQMLVKDVKCEGIHYLSITNEGEDQKVKNRGSKRKMPLHNGLVRLGFLDFVAERREAGERRLFPELKLSEYGYYSEDFSKWFSRYLTQIGIKTDKVSFHSLRHCFEDACRTARLDGGVMDALQGHSESGQRGRYGKGFDLVTLNEDVQELDHFPKSLRARMSEPERGGTVPLTH